MSLEELDSKFKSHELRIKSLEESNSKLKESNTKLKESITELEQSNTELKKSITELKESKAKINNILLHLVDADVELEDRMIETDASIEMVYGVLDDLKNLVKPAMTFKTCSDIEDIGLTRTANYFLDTDGPRYGTPAFTATCNFTDGKIIT